MIPTLSQRRINTNNQKPIDHTKWAKLWPQQLKNPLDLVSIFELVWSYKILRWVHLDDSFCRICLKILLNSMPKNFKITKKNYLYLKLLLPYHPLPNIKIFLKNS